MLAFPEALARFNSLLAHEGWPATISWVAPEHVLAFPGNKTALFLPGQPGDSQSAARAFEAARDQVIPVELYGVGSCSGVSYAYVRAIHELGQGEAMFVEHGIKVLAAASPPVLVIVRSPFWWSVVRYRHRRWLRRRDRPLANAA